MILKNTTIGDNCIIGARAVVKGVVPSNTVWAGCPARQICTIDELYKKRASKRLEEALYRRNIIRERYNREPTISEMGLFCFLFLERNESNYNSFVKDIDFNGIREHNGLRTLFWGSTPQFACFEDFLNHDIVD